MGLSDAVYVTDAECAARIGLTTEDLKAKLSSLERIGFPMKDPLFSNRRYWPAVRAFLDKRNGLESSFQRRKLMEPVVKDGKIW